MRPWRRSVTRGPPRPAAASSPSSSSSSPSAGSDVAARRARPPPRARRPPRRRRRSRPPSARRGRRRHRPPPARSRSAARSARLPETWTTSAPCSSAKCVRKLSSALAGAAEKNATRRPVDRLRPGAGEDVPRTPGRELACPLAQPLPARSFLGHRQHDEVGDAMPVLVQVAGDDRRILLGVRRRGSGVPVSIGGRAAPLPSKSTSSGSSSSALRAPCVDVRGEDGAGEAAAAAPAADRRHARQRRRLEVVGRRVPAGVESSSSASSVGGDLGDLGLGRPAASHRDDDDAARPRASSDARVGRDRRLADPLAGAHDADRGQRERLEAPAARSGSRRPRTAVRARAPCWRAGSARRGPSTGSSERSTTTSGRCSSSAPSSVSASGTP